jgi:hypothetical protein
LLRAGFTRPYALQNPVFHGIVPEPSQGIKAAATRPLSGFGP